MAITREQELSMQSTGCTCGCCGPTRQEPVAPRAEVGQASQNREPQTQQCDCGCAHSGCTCGCDCCG